MGSFGLFAFWRCSCPAPSAPTAVTSAGPGVAPGFVPRVRTHGAGLGEGGGGMERPRDGRMWRGGEGMERTFPASPTRQLGTCVNGEGRWRVSGCSGVPRRRPNGPGNTRGDESYTQWTGSNAAATRKRGDAGNPRDSRPSPPSGRETFNADDSPRRPGFAGLRRSEYGDTEIGFSE